MLRTSGEFSTQTPPSADNPPPSGVINAATTGATPPKDKEIETNDLPLSSRNVVTVESVVQDIIEGKIDLEKAPEEAAKALVYRLLGEENKKELEELLADVKDPKNLVDAAAFNARLEAILDKAFAKIQTAILKKTEGNATARLIATAAANKMKAEVIGILEGNKQLDGIDIPLLNKNQEATVFSLIKMAMKTYQDPISAIHGETNTMLQRLQVGGAYGIIATLILTAWGTKVYAITTDVAYNALDMTGTTVIHEQLLNLFVKIQALIGPELIASTLEFINSIPEINWLIAVWVLVTTGFVVYDLVRDRFAPKKVELGKLS